jgi:hypothetical protein
MDFKLGGLYILSRTQREDCGYNSISCPRV